MKIIIDENKKEKRVDRFLKKLLFYAPLSFIYKCLRENVKVNGKKVKENYILKEGDELIINGVKEIEKLIKNEKEVFTELGSNLDIVYEDKNILIVNKPYNLLVHGDKNEKKRTLTNYVLNYLYKKNEYDPSEKTFTPSPNNRLDRNTKGLIIFSKVATALREMNKLFKNTDKVNKYYLALVQGEINEERTIEGVIKRDSQNNVSKVILNKTKNSDNKDVKTIIYPLKVLCKKNSLCSIVRIKLITGRTHQIRASLKAIGNPLLFDKKYNQKNSVIKNSSYKDSYKLVSYKIVFGDIKGELSYLSNKEFSLNEKDIIDEIKNSI